MSEIFRNLLIMKKIFLIFLATMVFLPLSGAASETNGFLVFEIGRYAYKTNGHGGNEVVQKFKIPLTEEFLQNFRHLPNQNSTGTGFCCSGGNLAKEEGSTGFSWWLEKTIDHRWRIHMWSQGVDSIGGTKLNSAHQSCTQSMVISRLEDLDMSYQLSYVNKPVGLNVEITAKYVSAKDIPAEGTIPDAPVTKSDRSPLFKGNDLSHLPITIRCVFQEG